MDEFNAAIARQLRMFAAGVSLLAIVFGCWVLFGWVFDVSIAKTIIPGQVAVKANTAVCFILIGLALWLTCRLEPLSSVLRMTVWFATLTVSAVGAISFAEFLTGWDPGFDQLLINVGPEDAPGSVRAGLMSPIAAVSFLLLGAAIAGIHTRRRSGRWLVQFCLLVVTVATIFGVLDFVLDAGNTHTYISPVTAFVLLVMAMSIPLVELEYGLGRFLASDSSGGTLIRRLLPASLLVPVGLGWLRWRWEEAGLYSGWWGVSLMIVGTAILLAGMIVWTAHIADGTDRERLRAQGNNLRLAAIVNCSNEAIIGKTLEGVIMSWNPGAEAIYGYTAQEMIGQSVSILVPAEHQEEFQEILERVKRGEQIHSYETERIRKDGTRIMVAAAVAPIRDASGNLLGASAIVRDITEQKRAQEEIKRASRYARSLIEASVDPLVTISKAGKIMDVNRATEQATGCTREQPIRCAIICWHCGTGRGTSWKCYTTRVFFATSAEKWKVCSRPHVM